jgi:polysaccharide chain length determinant protein (PEP-CTERM system associated)
MILTGAVLYAHYAPKQYMATARILVTPQKISEAFVRSTAASGIESRISSISLEIMSLTHLENIISEFKLYDEEARSLNREEIVELMKENMWIQIPRSEKNILTISYAGKDPTVVAGVTNRLASILIEENLKFREEEVQGTSEFLSDELKSTKAKLEGQEKAINEFKQQYMGELPEQRDANFRVLEQLQTLHEKLEDRMETAEERKGMIRNQLSELETLLTSGDGKPDKSLLSVRKKSSEETRLDQLRDHLDDLRIKYTEKHPDIAVVKKKIAELEEKVEKSAEEKVQQIAEEKVEKSADKKNAEPGDFKLNPRYREVNAQLTATEREIKKLKEEEERLRVQMARYQKRIDGTFGLEGSLAALTRDYQNTNELYQSLLRKKQEARQAENLEQRHKGEQFKVIDPARPPEKPFKPNVQKILLMGLFLGLGFGFGLAFMREQMDRSFRDAEDLETTLGFKVLANIPKIEGKAA